MAEANSVLSTPPTNTSPRQPEKPQEALYLPADTTPEQIFQAIGQLRKEARDEIDRLIAFIDKTDDYVSRELEDDGDQQDASFPENCRQCTNPMEDDEDDDAGEDDDPAEPSLGSTNDPFGNGTLYVGPKPGETDCEGDEHDGREECDLDDDTENEPSLGWPDGRTDQTDTGGTEDRELATNPTPEEIAARPVGNGKLSNVGQEPFYADRRRRGFSVRRIEPARRPAD